MATDPVKLRKIRELAIELESSSESGVPRMDAALFLDGNDDTGSIGCNLLDHPGMDEFRRVFAKVRQRPDVFEMLVVIADTNEEGEWPFTDTLLVRTSASADDLLEEFETLTPDDVYEVDEDDHWGLKQSEEGEQWVAVWWD